MTTDVLLPDFDQMADIYWRLGVMQSPSQLHGFLTGRLSAGDELATAEWLAEAARYIDAVESPDAADSALLQSLHLATAQALAGGEMAMALLLPDDAVEITLRVDALGQWCQGFLAGFAQGGKTVQQRHGQQQYAPEVSEALSDLAAISQIRLSDDDDVQQSEQHVVEVAEYLRVAAMTIYLECRQSLQGTAPTPPAAASDAAKPALSSPGHLFGGAKKHLH